MSEMRPKVAELFAYMDSTRAALLADARNMNEAFASIRPGEGEWSAAETLNHLALVESSVATLLAKTVAAAREQGIGPDTSEKSFMSSLDHFRIVEPTEALQSPTRVAPDASKPVRESVESLERTRAELKRVIAESSDIDLHALRYPHRVIGEIDMYQWALFVAQHEERHRRQMARALAKVTERAAETAPIV